MRRKKNSMGLISCILIIIGACIGSAIFSISGMTIWYAGGSAVISWLIAAIIFALFGFILAELAGRFPESGGIYKFPKRAIGGDKGACVAFFCTWGYIISNLIAIGFSAIYVGIFIREGIPQICAIFGSATGVSIFSVVLTIAILLLGGRLSQRIQNIFVMVLIVTMIIYCISAFFGGHFDTGNFSNFFTQGIKGKRGFISAIPLALVAYGGCAVIAYLNAEVKNAKKNVPLAIFFGLLFVALFYASILIAIIGTIPHDVFCENSAVRLSPIFATFTVGGLSDFPWIGKLVAICGVFALLTTMTALLRVNARAIQTVASQGFFPKVFYKETAFGVPSKVILAMGLITILMCLIPEKAEVLIRLGALLNVISMSIVCISLIYARKQEVNYDGFKAPGGIVIAILTLIVFVICYAPEINAIGLPIWLFTLATYAVGLIIYLSGKNNSARRISGTVVHGKGHGNIAGIPTANLEPFPGEKLPKWGVWKTTVLVDGETFYGLTNVGTRPSDDDSNVPTIETHILNFNRDIYGCIITVVFEKWIRETRKFENLDELKKQIDRELAEVYSS